jgi:hypothetical protein
MGAHSYQLVVLDGRGRAAARRELSCPDEEQAIDLAHRLTQEHRFGLELWDSGLLLFHCGPRPLS